MLPLQKASELRIRQMRDLEDKLAKLSKENKVCLVQSINGSMSHHFDDWVGGSSLPSRNPRLSAGHLLNMVF